jgi:hypothetical protein
MPHTADVDRDDADRRHRQRPTQARDAVASSCELLAREAMLQPD